VLVENSLELGERQEEMWGWERGGAASGGWRKGLTGRQEQE